MRSSALVVAAIVMGLVGVADAKLLACWPALQSHEVGGLRVANPDDRTAPVTPVIRSASVDGNTLYVDARFADDTALVEITMLDSHEQRFIMWTTPHSARAVCLAGNVASGSLMISFAAHDAAGNVSSAVATTEVPYRYRRCGCGGGAIVLVLLAPVVLVGGAVALLVLCILRRRRLRQPAEPVSLLVAESITRTILQRNVIALGIGIAAVIVLNMLDRWGSAVLTSAVPLTAFTRVFAARRVLAALERDDAVAALHGTQLQVGMRDIQASNGLIERARKHSVPAGFARDI